MPTIALTIHGQPAVLTTDHAASSYGQPVLVIAGKAYGQEDIYRGRRVADLVAEAAATAATRQGRREARRWAGAMLPAGRPPREPRAPQERVSWTVDADVLAVLRAEHDRTGETFAEVLKRLTMLALPERFGQD